MSRHRNVRAMNYNEEYDTYYDVYGQSVEDEMCISPRTAAEFMYDRDGKAHSMSAYLESEGGGNENLEDGESTESIEEKDTHRSRAESVTEYPENLSEVDEAKLRSCVEEMQNVVGETISEGMLIKAAIDNLYDLEKSLNAVLSQAFASEQAKPQRAKKERSEFSSLTLKPQSPYLQPTIKDKYETTDNKAANACSSSSSSSSIESQDIEPVNLSQFIKKLAAKNSIQANSNVPSQPNSLKNEPIKTVHTADPKKFDFHNTGGVGGLNLNPLMKKSVFPSSNNSAPVKPFPDLKTLAKSDQSTSLQLHFPSSNNSTPVKPFPNLKTLAKSDQSTPLQLQLHFPSSNNSMPLKPFTDLKTLAKSDQSTSSKLPFNFSTPSNKKTPIGNNSNPALTLADLAKQKEKNNISINKIEKNMPSLKFSNLKTQNPFIHNEIPNQNLSLADLAKEHLESLEKTVQLPNSFGNYLKQSSDIQSILREDNNIKYSGWLTAKHDISSGSECHTPIKSEIKPREIFKTLTKPPSVFGFVLCMRFRVKIPPKITIVQHLKECTRKNVPNVFDFSTLSPDDIMKEKQFQAFRDTVKTTIMEDAKETLKPITEITTVVVQPEEDEKSSEACNFTTNNNTNTNQLNPVKPNRAKSRSPSPANGGGDIEVENTTQSRRQRFSDTNPQEAYSKERLSGKPLINLVVIGHVDAGKSTLMGHLLYRLGCVTKKLMHKNEQDSKKLGKSSFMYAWVLDETPEERNRGITMDIAQSKFETKQRLVTLLDAPGHKDFIPNMITGAAQADVAILVVDATRGEFETGFEAGGQTREHAILVRSLGVSQLAVAVNKLDNVDWSKERYDEIVSKLTAFLKQAGYKEKDASFVPCSGLTGENLTELSKSCPLSSWYDGPCLVDVIDNFKPPERPVSKPFRMCISDIFKGMGAGFCVGGRVESGHIENGNKLLVLPAGEQATVKGIAIDEVSQSQAFAGDHVTLGLSGVDMNKVMVGDVVCDPHKPVKVSTRFRARIVVFNIDSPLTQGYPVVLHYQSMSEQAVIRKIITQLHKSTGEVVKKKPRFLLKNSSGLIEIEVVRPICVELYKDNRDLGRFMLRSCGTTVAAGLVTQVM